MREFAAAEKRRRGIESKRRIWEKDGRWLWLIAVWGSLAVSHLGNCLCVSGFGTFLTPQRHTIVSIESKRRRSRAQSMCFATKEKARSIEYNSIVEFNEELNELARRCLDDDPNVQEDVIGLAAMTESKVMELQTEHDNSDEKVLEPDVVSYNTVLVAWSKAAIALSDGRGRGTIDSTVGIDMNQIQVFTARDAALHASQFLSSMATPSNDNDDDDDDDAAADNVKVKPNVFSYNSVLDAWAKVRASDSALQAEGLIEKMEQNADSRLRPNIASYNSLFEAWAHSPSGTFILTVGDDGNKEPQNGLQRAVSVLEQIQTQYQQTNDERIKPNIRAINSVINAYAKKGAEPNATDTATQNDQASNFVEKESRIRMWLSAQKAHKLLQQTLSTYQQTKDEEFKPDVTTYTSVIDAYARVGSVKAAECATELLEQMLLPLSEDNHDDHDDTAVLPNVRTFTAVLNAWARVAGNTGGKQSRDAASKAETLLQRMEDIHNNQQKQGQTSEKLQSVKPNVRSYTTAITAWARSNDKKKAQRSLRLLKKIIALYKAGDADCKPNIFAYNAAIDACAKTQGSFEDKTEALKIAFAIRKAVQKDKEVEANHVTYGTLIRAAHKCMPRGKERNDIVRAVFETCKKAGQADAMVLKYLQMAVDQDVYRELMEPVQNNVSNQHRSGNSHLEYEDLPMEWRRNVR